jgi:raffinose/stachyose/melibiose transport system substrate-binding protein
MKAKFTFVLMIALFTSMISLTVAQEDVTLQFWFVGSEQTNQFNEEIIAAFEAENPNIDIVYQPYGPEPFKTALQVALASNEPPDMFFNWSGDDTGRYIREGHLLDLSEYSEQYDWAARMSPATLDAFTFDGQLYGVPITTEVKYFYYNLAIFEEMGLEVPETFDDLIGICETLREAGITPLAFGNGERWEGVHYLSIFNQKSVDEETMRSDYALTSPEDELFTDPNYVEAFQRLVDMREAGCFADGANSTVPSSALALFFTEQTAMYYQGTWIIGQLDANEFEGQYGLFRMPALTDDMAQGNQNYVLMGTSGLEISSQTQHPDEAAKFYDYYVSLPAQLKYVEVTSRIPVNLGAVDPDLMSDELVFVVDDLGTAEGAVSWLDVVLENSVSEVYLNSIQEVYAGTKTPEEAVAAVREQALIIKADLGR